VLLGLFGLLLGLVHLPDNLLVVLDQLLVLLGALRRLVSVRSSERRGVVSELGLLLIGGSLFGVGLGGVGDVVGEGSLVFRVETLVRVFGSDFESLAGLGVAWGQCGSSGKLGWKWKSRQG